VNGIDNSFQFCEFFQILEREKQKNLLKSVLKQECGLEGLNKFG
jgi:hypothetical protein